MAQLSDLITPISELSDEELLERLRTIRHNRTTARPAAAARAKRAAKKGTQARVNKVESLLDGLNPEQLLELMAQLGES